MADLKLSAFDEMPQIRTYTTLLLLFPVAPAAKQIDLVEKLESAARTLKATFPYLATRVTPAESNNEKSNALKLTPSFDIEKSHVVVNDIKDTFATYQQISEAKAPASMLDSKALLPIKTFPFTYEGASAEPSLIIRANFVEGGLLLGFALLHNVGDGNDMGKIVKMFSTLSRGEPLNELDIEAGNLDRDLGAPPLQPGQRPLQHDHLLKKDAGHDEAESTGPPSELQWAYYRITSTKLAQLKAADCKSSNPDGNPASWASSNDLLSALVWRAYTQASQPRLSHSKPRKCMRAINARSKIEPPLRPGFTGNVIMGTYTSLSPSDLSHNSVYATATHLRKSVLEVNDHFVRSHASFWRSVKDKKSIQWGAPMQPGDICISSFAGQAIYECDFGPGIGKPELVRRPTTAPTDGLAYILPKDREGNLDVFIGMREDDRERMGRDEVWSRWMEYIG